jgi:CTP-dependent riboflavin kinase
MNIYSHVFKDATGEDLYPGTINVQVNRSIVIREDFRIRGSDIGEPAEDFIFERCRINGVDAYRIRPLNLKTGYGGHGDHILEISSSKKISGVEPGNSVEITLFRELSEP